MSKDVNEKKKVYYYGEEVKAKKKLYYGGEIKAKKKE